MGVNVNKKILLPLCVLVAFAPGVEADCVSNIPHYTSDRFKDNGDGTVTDNALKLMWMQCELGALWDTKTKACVSNLNFHPRIRVQWAEALHEAAIFNVTGGGFQGNIDWRMPNIKELSSLINYSCLDSHQIGIDPKVFPSAAVDVWTNTPGVQLFTTATQTQPAVLLSNTAWVVEFNYGKFRNERIDDPRIVHHIRLVREIR